MPRFSVLLPVWNAEATLAASLGSLLGQTFRDFEILAVDDGSVDRSGEILAACADPRLVVIRQERNGGIVSALTRALAAARAPWIARQDADDLSEPERLARQAEFLDAHPAVGLLGTACLKIDAAGEVLSRQTLPAEDAPIRAFLEGGNPFVHGSVVARTDLVRAAGGYRDTGGPVEDLDLWLRLLERTQGANLRDPLYRYRVGDGGVLAGAALAQARASRAFVLKLARQRRTEGRDPLEAGDPAALAERERLDRWRAASPAPSLRARRAFVALSIAGDHWREGDAGACLRWSLRAVRLAPWRGAAWRRACEACLRLLRGGRAGGA